MVYSCISLNMYENKRVMAGGILTYLRSYALSLMCIIIPIVPILLYERSLILVSTLKILLALNLFIFVIGPLIFRYSYFCQRSVIFLNFVNLPKNPDFSNPSKYGIDGVFNFYLTTDEGIKLGVWYILPEALMNERVSGNEQYYKDSLKNAQNVILYNHGNSGNRAASHRIELYKVLRKNFHVIAYDYRSYGDSSDVLPTETGLVSDSRFMYKWLRNLTSTDIFVWGHSLGTAITTHTSALLNNENIIPTGLILESPFNNMRDEISEHPLGRIFRHVPWFHYAIINPMQENNLTFTSDEFIKNVSCSILILHAKDDKIVPHHLGEKLHKVASSSRTVNQGKVYFHSFEKELNFGHKYICRSYELEDIIREFFTNCLEEQRKRIKS